MTIQATCDKCFRTYNVKDEYAGRRMKCPDCGATVQIPDGLGNTFTAADDVGGSFGGADFSDERGGVRERRPRKSRSAAGRSSGGSLPVAGILLGVVGVIAVLVCCGGIGLVVMLSQDEPIAAAEADRQRDLALARRQVGETREESGSLGFGDEKLESGEYSEEFTLSANRGDLYVVDMYSDEFDTYLIVRDEDDAGTFQLDNDDASVIGDPGHSQIIFSAPRDGTFLVIATSFEEGETGAYQLAIRDLTPAPDSGGPVREESGSLSGDDDQLEAGEYFDVHTVSAEPGDLLAIDLHSNEFDTYLFVTGPEGADFEIHNDDFEESEDHSHLKLLAPEGGDYEINVTSYEGGETGSYRLTIREL